jgi:hypothetical protein
VSKDTILQIAHESGIPYLKNSTPEWSNRGKFRTRFYEETHQQYGKHVDESVLKVADTLSTMGRMLDNLLYKPMFASYIDNCMCITRAIDSDLDENGWLHVFEWVCHTQLKRPKPSIHSIKYFVERIKTSKEEKMTFELKKGWQIKMYKENGEYYLKF